MENPKDSLSRVDFQLDVYIDDVAAEECNTVFVENEAGPTIAVCNMGARTIGSDAYSVMMTISTKDAEIRGLPVLRNFLPDGRVSYRFSIQRMFPGQWLSWQPKWSRSPKYHNPMKVAVQVASDLGVVEYPFTLLIQD